MRKLKIEKGMVFTINSKSIFNRYTIGDILRINGDIISVEVKWTNSFSKEIERTFYSYDQVIKFIEEGGWIIDYKQLRKDKLKKIKNV